MEKIGLRLPKTNHSKWVVKCVENVVRVIPFLKAWELQKQTTRDVSYGLDVKVVRCE
jgi:hypothetical protein